MYADQGSSSTLERLVYEAAVGRDYLSALPSWTQEKNQMRVIYAYEDVHDVAFHPTIFLAGPTPRSPEVPSWRPEAVRLMEGCEGTLYIPEPRAGAFNPDEQVKWEWDALAAAQHILFWVPRDLNTMPAFTTNVEFGYWVAKNYLKVTLAYPKMAPKMSYLHKLADKQGIPVYHALYEALMSIVKRESRNGNR